MPQKESTQEEYAKRVNKVVEYINHHLDAELELDTLASLSGFSPFHFHKIMKAFLREPLYKYICRIRLEKAARLLRHSSLSIQEITDRVGYEMPSSLSKAFKLQFGISPTEYKNNINCIIMRAPIINEQLNLKAPEIKEVPANKALYIRLIGAYSDNDYDKAWESLWKFVKARKLFTAGMEHFGVSYDDPKVTEEGKCRYEACLTIHKEAQPEGEIGVKEIAGGRFAVFLYQGPYTNLSAVYDTIFAKWLPESGCELREQAIMEKYLNNPNQTEPEKLKTEIYIPIK